MAARLITLTSDFGVGSPYVAAMKGVILDLHPAATIVNLSHAIPPQDIRAGALALETAAPYFPAGTIHMAVVDPGVGTNRAIVCVAVGEHLCLGPDNGLFSRLTHRQPPSAIFRVSDPRYWRPVVSATFHGRDIMAPVAARLSLGLPPEALGPPHSGLVTLEWREAVVVPGKIIGRVESIDSFGNLITDITTAQVAPCRDLGVQVRIECDEHETFGIFRTYGDVPPMTFVAIVSSQDRLELAITTDSAAEMLRIRVGTPVTVTW